jgi:hypothetical protein
MSRAELRSEVADVAALTPPLVERLFALHAASYEGVDVARFRADLAEKQWVILLREPAGEVVGFSTQRTLDVCVGGRAVRALFSGDTIVHPDFWGEQALVRAWCRLAGRVKAEAAGRLVYWFLISKGHRTYLYLPTFFRDFYPRFERPTPAFEAELIRVLGSSRYGDEFDEATGTVVPRASDRLRGELDAAPRRLSNPHVAFFCERNPDYAAGHELVCVAAIEPANMRRLAQRELLFGMASACGADGGAAQLACGAASAGGGTPR